MSWFERQIQKSIGAFLTKEVKTGAQHSDGRPIYRIVIDFGAGPNTTTGSVAHGVSGTIEVTRIWGTCTTGTLTLPLPHSSTTLANNIGLYRNGADVSIETGINLSARTCTVYMEYVKS